MFSQKIGKHPFDVALLEKQAIAYIKLGQKIQKIKRSLNLVVVAACFVQFKHSQTRSDSIKTLEIVKVATLIGCKMKFARKFAEQINDQLANMSVEDQQEFKLLRF